MAACRPVIVVLERPPEAVAPGQPLALDVHVVSDLRHALRGARTTVTATWDGGRHEVSWEGDVPADECTKVGTVRLAAPATPGELALRLRLRHLGDDVATNAYTTVVSP